jgi:nucleotidyltransferase/DNA polymerase involved in DNA repair
MLPPKSIVHLDADAFFASVEQAADPRLRGKPIAVGGEKRGIIASASYEARKFGVYTPMPTVRARKLCPKLIVLPGTMTVTSIFPNGCSRTPTTLRRTWSRLRLTRAILT